MPTPKREAEFLAVHEEWSQGRLTQVAAAAQLGMAERTFRRHAARLRSQGSLGWRDRSPPRPPSRRAPDDERASVETLYSEQYMGWTVRHFHERYQSEHGGTRSYRWVISILQAAALVEKRLQKGASERPCGEAEPEPIVRCPREGMLLHQIASRREWVPGHTWDLILMMDDATDRVHSGFFVEERRIWSTFAGIREVIERGLFDCLSLGVALPVRLTARETMFGGLTRPQLERVMSDLGIDLVRPAPRIRMRNTRVLGTLGGRLPQELARKDIAEIETANTYLARFWNRFNESRAINPSDPSEAFVGLLPSILGAVKERKFCLRHEARVCTGHRLLCEGKEMDLTKLGLRHLCTGKQYWIHEFEDGRCELFHGSDRIAAIDVNGVRPT